MALPLIGQGLGDITSLAGGNPAVTSTQQPGLVAAEEFGTFGIPASQAAAIRSQAVFNNQNLSNLAGEGDTIGLLQVLTGTQPIQQVGKVVSQFQPFGFLSSIPTIAWIAIGVIAVFLIIKR